MVAVMALMALLLLVPLTTTMSTLGASEVQIAQNHLQGTQAFYIAESGVEMAFASVSNATVAPASFLLGAGEGQITVEPGDTSEERVITGRGCVPACSAPHPARRVVRVVLEHRLIGETWKWTMRPGTWRDLPWS